MSKPTVVKFLKAWRGYSKDELAGFTEDEAQRLVDAEVAELSGKAKGARGAASRQQPSAPAPEAGKGAGSNDQPPAGGGADADEKP